MVTRNGFDANAKLIDKTVERGGRRASGARDHLWATASASGGCFDLVGIRFRELGHTKRSDGDQSDGRHQAIVGRRWLLRHRR